MSWASKTFLTCQDMSRLLSDAMDRSLPLHVRVRMRLHLLMCALCEQYKQHLQFLRTVLRKDRDGVRLHHDDHAQQPVLSPEAKERIQRALDSRHP